MGTKIPNYTAGSKAVERGSVFGSRLQLTEPPFIEHYSIPPPAVDSWQLCGGIRFLPLPSAFPGFGPAYNSCNSAAIKSVTVVAQEATQAVLNNALTSVQVEQVHSNNNPNSVIVTTDSIG